MDWFADLDHHSESSGLVAVGGLTERGEDHPCGADMFMKIENLNNIVMTLALRRPQVDPREIQSRTTHVKRVKLDYVVLHFR